MVVLSPRFTLLASLSVIAGLAFAPSTADAAAVEARHHPETFGKSSRTPNSSPIKSSGAKSRSSGFRQNSKDRSSSNETPTRDPKPTIPLPVGAYGQAKVQVQGAGPVSGKETKHHKAQNKRQFFYDPFNPLLQLGNLWIGDRPPPERNFDRTNARVQVHRSSTPQSHDHHHTAHAKVIVNGDHDHIDVLEKKAIPDLSTPLLDEEHSLLVPNQLLPRHNKHHHVHGSKVSVNGNGEYVHVHRRDNVYQFEGVPGTVDIMSDVADSTSGQKIASLVLSATNGTNGSSPGDPFILNASSTNQTQVYLIALPPDDTSDSSNSTTAATSESSNSTSSANSTTADTYRKVAITIPLFDAENAVMESYCATFDPKPPAPAPLTVERCTNGTQNDEHKSQVFAFEPSTGIIRPMWFEGEDDGTEDDDTDSLEDKEAGTPVAPEDGSNNSTSVAPQDPGTPSTDKTANVTSIDSRMVDEEDGDVTSPPNVTLVFSPAPPTVASSNSEKVGDGPADSASSVDPASTSTLSSSSADTFTAAATLATLSSSAPASASETVSASVSAMDALFTSTTQSDTPVSFASASSTTTSTAVVTTASASAISESTGSPANPTSGALDVEVFDPNATGSMSTVSTATSASITSSSTSPLISLAANLFAASTTDAPETSTTVTSSAADSSSPSVSSTVSSTSAGIEAVSSSSVSATSVATSATTSMTPVSTAPYEWMFKEGIAKDV
ncbi:unnamed protein product [Somion occarium]|uniref:Uncharacterized protein n=1 Tax=Somion occarium TaxID=3059160 RepID=A0ABP1E3E9_9APHY